MDKKIVEENNIIKILWWTAGWLGWAGYERYHLEYNV
jgi:hypothetical protein